MCERYPEGAAAPPLPPPPFDISSGPKQLFVIFSYPLTPRSDDLNADAYRQILANKQTNKQFSFKFDLGCDLGFSCWSAKTSGLRWWDRAINPPNPNSWERSYPFLTFRQAPRPGSRWRFNLDYVALADDFGLFFHFSKRTWEEIQKTSKIFQNQGCQAAKTHIRNVRSYTCFADAFTQP